MKLNPGQKRRIEDGIAAKQAEDLEENLERLERTVRVEAWGVVGPSGRLIRSMAWNAPLMLSSKREGTAYLRSHYHASFAAQCSVIPVTITGELPKKGKR